MNSPKKIPCQPGSTCACSKPALLKEWSRRDFIASLGAVTGLLASDALTAMAGPFTRKDFETLVPADKKLRPEWIRSLTERGQRTVYRGAEVEKIGMPIGGICAGQVYLGGDGRLWHWDIFNRHVGTGAEHYANPMPRSFPFEQGFALRYVRDKTIVDRPLDRTKWREVSFTGEYPIGYVGYRDADCPIEVDLQAFSPFIPLNAEDSSLPATIMEFTLKNRDRSSVEVTLAGWLQNAACLHSSENRGGMRHNRLMQREGMLALECAAEARAAEPPSGRPDISFDDFERENYGPWKSTGTAFGNGPVPITELPAYQGDVGGNAKRVVNSHASAPGNSVEEKDSAKGTLTSAPFKIERHYISFLIGGGAHKGRTCMNLLVEGQPVLSATGSNNNRMRSTSWDVRQWEGRSGVLQIVDDEPGPWGNVGVDDIMFSDNPRPPLGPLGSEPDFGTMTLALLDASPNAFGVTEISTELPAGACDGAGTGEPVKKPFPHKPVGAIGKRLKIAAGRSAKVTFVICWHFPNLKLSRLPTGRHYGTRFDSAVAVALYVRRNFEQLAAATRLWHDTWYDSSLPYWFLDRTFLNTSILASSTCYRLGDGRFYAWEGVGCCEGTCGHVWQYAHAMARLFPELERITRERVDFGLAQQPDGAIHFRGEFNDIPAIDAQAGTILRALREHQMSPDGRFLKRIWPRVKKATDWLIAKDANNDGLIESNQHNTLDTDWWGPASWLSGLYLAALMAAERMASELEDTAFAFKCRSIVEAGRKKLVSELFDGEYFINKPDPKHLEAINSGSGCEIDQVFGQSWAWQVGLGRVLPKAETLSALRSLWRYNFTPDVGPYRKAYKAGRWYAMAGEAGLLMCTFPRNDWDYQQAKGKGPEWAAGYFNECMNGFEYQAAGHMIWEGMVTEGLAVTRAIHDRYNALRRNPWNEVECGDHYARSMASYGVFLAACGFEYDGPAGHIGFSPKVSNSDTFKAAFTGAEGWGTFQQKLEAAKNKTNLKQFRTEIAMKQGILRMRTLALNLPEQVQGGSVLVRLGNRVLRQQSLLQGNQLRIVLAEEAQVTTKTKLEVRVN